MAKIKTTLVKTLAHAQELLPTTNITHQAHKLADNTQPFIKNTLINTFCKLYDINLNDYPRARAEDYASFNDFFTRELFDGARPIDPNPSIITSPADGQISQIGKIDDGMMLQAKGRHYSLEQLLACHKDAHTHLNAQFATIYLAPHNYHRVHMPFDGRLKKTRYVSGKLFSVNHATAQNIPDLFARNERLICFFETDFGEAVVILVGALIVGGIQLLDTPIMRTHGVIDGAHDTLLQKGDELGRFFLGSTAIVIVPYGTWHMTAGQTVQMGMPLGALNDGV